MSTAPTKRRRKSQGYRTTVNPSKRHRDRLNVELEKLSKLLPYSDDVVSRLDKLSVLRLSVSYVRAKKHFKGVNTETEAEKDVTKKSIKELPTTFGTEGIFSCLFNEAIDGFLIVIVEDGELFFIGESVSHYLGYSQSQMLHQNLFTFTQENDHEELRAALNPTVDQPKIVEVNEDETEGKPEVEEIPRSILLRLKSVTNSTSSDTYRPFKIVGRLKPLYYADDGDDATAARYGLFGICTPAKSSYSMLELRMKSTLFCSKNRLDLSFLDMDASGKDVFGYTKKDLLGRSSYVMVHKSDLQHLKCKHQEITTVGKSTLATFRLLGKNNEWLWVCGYARVLLKNGRPDFVVTTNRLMGDEEGQAMLKNRDEDDHKALVQIGFYPPDDPDEACRLGFPQLSVGLGPCPPAPSMLPPYAMKDPLMPKMNHHMNTPNEAAIMMQLSDAAISMNMGENALDDEGCNLLEVSDEYFDYPMAPAILDGTNNLFDLSPSAIAPVGPNDPNETFQSIGSSSSTYGNAQRQKPATANLHYDKEMTPPNDEIKSEQLSPQAQPSCQNGNPQMMSSIVQSIGNLDVTQSTPKVYTTLSDASGYYEELPVYTNMNNYPMNRDHSTPRHPDTKQRPSPKDMQMFRDTGKAPSTGIPYYSPGGINTNHSASVTNLDNRQNSIPADQVMQSNNNLNQNGVPPNVTLPRSDMNPINLNVAANRGGVPHQPWTQHGKQNRPPPNAKVTSEQLPMYLQMQQQQQQQQQLLRNQQQQLLYQQTHAQGHQDMFQRQQQQQQQAINSIVFPPSTNFNGALRPNPMSYTQPQFPSFSVGKPQIPAVQQRFPFQ